MSFGGGGGGSYSTKGMEEATNKSLALQKEIYDQNRTDTMPWLNTGSAAINRLGLLMGLNGTSANNTPSSRQSLIDQYKGQFTTTAPTSQGSQYIGPDGRIYDTSSDSWRENFQLNNQSPRNEAVRHALTFGGASSPEDMGFKAMQTGGGSTTDMAALNKYVDDLLAKQGAENEADPMYGALTKKFSLDDFNQDPGYQFRMDQGNKAMERIMASRGQVYSPQVTQALMDLNQNMGAQEYGASYDRFNNDQNTLYNRLANIAGMGQTATGQTAASGQSYANNASDLWTNLANAQAAAAQAKASTRGSMFGNILGGAANLGSSYLMSQAGPSTIMFSDARMKENISKFDVKNGYQRYVFNYKGDDTDFIGVMAQDILETNPDAVSEDNGIYMVDYSKLGFPMEVL